MDYPPLQSNHSWCEPVEGSRNEWKCDRWRYGKIAAALIPVFFICFVRCDSIDSKFYISLAGLTVFVLGYFWVFTFFPRIIVLRKDVIAVYRGGSRQISAAFKIRYADIWNITISSAGQNQMATLILASGKEVVLYAKQSSDIAILDALVKKHIAKATCDEK